MKFSLIMGTYGRDDVIRSFLQSLEKQTHRNFELIVVDQNTDDRVERICDEYTDLNITHLRTDKTGLSHARNVGLKHVSGDIIAFPDDDCQYPPDLLARVHDFFITNPHYEILTGAGVDPQTFERYSWFLSLASDLTETNLLRACTSFTIFIKSKDNLIRFDEQFGVGASFGCAEEVDYLLRLLRSGRKGHFDPTLEVRHPERTPENMSLATLGKYSLGLGAYLKKHAFFERSWKLLGACLNLLLIRPAVAMILSLLKLDMSKFAWYRTALKGRNKGFFAYDSSCYATSKTYEQTD